ncbi:hypothetical protein EV378_0396 [Pseudonocardia endophytica]|uniref:Uncharacterized protein n=1 Tax=Pseudonocardia endophytica TaxID=401976 RepID=A0A4R1HTC3_PSEEN|nr:hypothetical protein EV378_0396 [Pseudonocardia endophytica]
MSDAAVDVAEVERAAAARERRELLRPSALAGVVVLLAAFMSGAVLVLAQVDPEADLATKLVALGGVVVVWLLVTAVAAAVLVWGFVRLRRRGWPMLARSPLWELDSAVARRDLVRAIRRGDPIPAGQERLALRTARHVAAARRRRWFTAVVVVLAVVLLGAGWLVGGTSPWGTAGFVVVYLAAGIALLRSQVQIVAAVPRLEHLASLTTGTSTPDRPRRPEDDPGQGPP